MTWIDGHDEVVAIEWPDDGAPTLHHPAWSQLPTRSLVRVADGGPPTWPTYVRLAADHHAIWLRFECPAATILATMHRYKDKVWQEDAVEVYLKPPRDPYLYEFQLSPIGTTRDLRVVDAGHPHQIFDDSWSCRGLVTEASVAEDGHSSPVRWEAMFGLPWAAFGQSAPWNQQDTWRIGLFRIERDPEEFSGLIGVPQGAMELHDPRFLRRLVVARKDPLDAVD